MEGLIILGLFYLASALFGRAMKGKEQQRRAGRRPGAGTAPARTPAAGRTPTQREAERLEDLLERLGFEVELEPDPPAPLQRPRLPPPEPEANVVSLELPPERPLRLDESQDDAAPLLVARRIKEAAARSGALTDADHAAFDARIRRAPVQRPVRVSRSRLQEAVVWREVLGPPAALGGSQAMWDA